MISGTGMATGSEQAPLRIASKQLKLARVAASGTSNTTATLRALVSCPSRRLSLAISVAFEPSAAGVPTTFGSSVWTLTGLRQNPTSRRLAELHAIETGAALPRMYELDSAIRMYRAACTLGIPRDAGSVVTVGDWWLIVEAEPNQLICDRDIDGLLQLVDVRAEFSATETVLAP